MSQTTKKALAASLKNMLANKPLDKIKITDITEDCEVNRQTFYYHFKDIYDLLEWVYTNEATRAIGDKKTYSTWQEGFTSIFKYILDSKEFVLNTYNSVSREYLERYLYNDKSFIADFYKYAFVGLVLDWIKRGMKEKPEYIIEKLNILISGNIEKALESYRTDKHVVNFKS